MIHLLHPRHKVHQHYNVVNSVKNSCKHSKDHNMIGTTLGKLTKGRQPNPVCIQVMRKWTFVSTHGDRKPVFIGLVVVDKQGTAMYAEIPREVLHTHGPLLEPGNTYNISRFQIKNARPTYMPFEANLMIEIGCYTLIDVVTNPPDTFPKYVYSITPFSALKTMQGSTKTYIDVIGYLSKIESPTTIIPRGRETVATLREIIIKDMSDTELTITLWGQDATSFTVNHLYDDASPKIVVILFQGCVAKDMSFKLQISAGSAFQYFLNPDIPEAQPFYNRFRDQAPQIQLPSAEEAPQQLEAKPLDHITVLELNKKNPYELPTQGCKCTVRVTRIPQNDDWWYLSCFNCTKAAQPQDSGGYYCTKCKTTQTRPRYRLTFFAADETDEGMFFCYDNIAYQLIQTSCSALINKQRTVPGFPAEIMKLISKTFVFAIHPTDDCFSTKIKKFQVDVIVDRSDRRGSTLSIVLPTDNAERLPAPEVPLAIDESSSTRIEVQLQELSDQTKDPPLLLTPGPAKDADELAIKHDQIKELKDPGHTRRELFPQHDQSHIIQEQQTEDETLKPPRSTQQRSKRVTHSESERPAKKSGQTSFPSQE